MPFVNDVYLGAVDHAPEAIYCNHDFFGENKIARHVHVKGQLLYSEGGVVHVITDDKSYFMPARHYMWIPPQVAHSIVANSPEVTLRNIYFPMRVEDPVFFERIGIYPVNDLLLEMLLYTKRFGGEVMPSAYAGYSFMMGMKAVLPEVSGHELPLAVPYPQHVRLLEVCRYMNAHLEEPLLFPELSHQFGFSERTLSRLFKQELDMSFVQYLTLQRILRALQLLLEEKKTVNEVAYLVGYKSVPTFSNTFLKIVGARPSEYLGWKGVL